MGGVSESVSCVDSRAAVAPGLSANWSEVSRTLRFGLPVAWIRRALPPKFVQCAEAFAELDREPILAHLRHRERRNDLYRRVFRAESASRFQPLMSDIDHCLDEFWEVAKPRWLRVSLEAPTDDNCKLFHTDNVELRLLCTYCGPGTQWLPNHRVRREGLGKGDNSLVIIGEEPPFQLPTGAIGILKGERFPGNVGDAAVHRSPPIEGSGIRRLLLRVDAEGCRS